MFTGSIPALVTPFRNGKFDEVVFRAHVDRMIDGGSSAVVPCGTTGESATMTIEEHNYVMAVCIDQVNGRVPVIAGCGSNDTKVSLLHLQHAAKAGATAGLVVLPYYNKPSQDGLFAHYSYLAENSPIPILIYNVPGRTGSDISVETLARLSRLPAIVGMKDASGHIARVSAQRLACGADFCQLSGNDDMALAFNAMGGVGCISVTANVAPKLSADFQKACAENRYQDALVLQDLLYPLHSALFSDSSPAPVKYALSRLYPEFSSELRLPLVPPSEKSQALVDAALSHARLI